VSFDCCKAALIVETAWSMVWLRAVVLFSSVTPMECVAPLVSVALIVTAWLSEP
jgi:hypothetical protein